MEILVPKQYTPQQVKEAELKATEFKPGRFTSGCANLDDMIELKKAVTLCPDHARKFKPMSAKYMAHPNPKLRRVIAYCDVCTKMGLSNLYLNAEDAVNEHRKLENYKRSCEYSQILTG